MPLDHDVPSVYAQTYTVRWPLVHDPRLEYR